MMEADKQPLLLSHISMLLFILARQEMKIPGKMIKE
jgi:hypothetical protein